MAPTSRLQLSLSARNLKNLSGFLQKSDPFAVVTVRGDNPDNAPYVAGQTEVVYNNLNPSWSTVVFIDGYKFGVPFYVEVGVFDFDAQKIGMNEREMQQKSSVTNLVITATPSSRDLYKTGRLPHKVMGTALFEVGEMLAARGNFVSKSLQTGGAVYAHIERSRDEGEMGNVRLQFQGVDLSNTHLFKSSPFFEMYRKVDRPIGAIWSSVYRSNVVRCDLNPLWEEVILSFETACNGDLQRAIKVVVWDHRRNGKHKSMGEFETSMGSILDAANGLKFFSLRLHDQDLGKIAVIKADLVQREPEPKSRENTHTKRPPQNVPQSPPVGIPMTTKQIMPPSTPVGIPLTINVAQRPEFVDYLSGGCEINLAVAIDFTASNGDPRQPGTPHYFHPTASKEFNDYEQAIYAVGQILAKFDSDHMFPVWGFGAKYGDTVRHCFQCGNEVEVHRVKGILDAYRGVFNTPLTMSYPTVFKEVIRTASNYAKHKLKKAQREGHLSYTILLILTAGNDENILETKRELIKASSCPLSVVIVGIGDADFSNMALLDEHDPHTERGRDITKFVAFNEYDSYNDLTSAVLDEIPDQLVDFYYEKGILPPESVVMGHDEVEIMPADDDERTVNFLG